jgi:probable F420-dependent oxidoreductase
MQIGLHCLGIGAGARPEVIRAIAATADSAGFDRLWAGEHVVMTDRPQSRYPYAADGKIAVPADADWLDPFVCLTFAAAVTDRIGLATGVLLLPEHGPVQVAKRAASLDLLCHGRLTLGVGTGWSAEEFAALGVPFDRRGQRTAEYIAVLRALWSDDVASFHGEFARFEAVRVYPKPVRGRVPVVLGGNTDSALDRAATIGDGWYGFNLSTDEAVSRVAVLTDCCRRLGRDARELTVAVALTDGNAGNTAELEAAGVTEVVIVGAPPPVPDEAAAWVGHLAEQWVAR